jgi:hypothetical protein
LGYTKALPSSGDLPLARCVVRLLLIQTYAHSFCFNSNAVNNDDDDDDDYDSNNNNNNNNNNNSNNNNKNNMNKLIVT